MLFSTSVYSKWKASQFYLNMVDQLSQDEQSELFMTKRGLKIYRFWKIIHFRNLLSCVRVFPEALKTKLYLLCTCVYRFIRGILELALAERSCKIFNQNYPQSLSPLFSFITLPNLYTIFVLNCMKNACEDMF